jgi:hypothetical protein
LPSCRLFPAVSDLVNREARAAQTDGRGKEAKEETTVETTSLQIFDDMRETIVETLTEGWAGYIDTVVAAYGEAYTRVKTLLGAVQAEIVAREKSQQALMVAVLSVATGGVVGVFAEKLASKLVPAAEKLETTAVYAANNAVFVQVSKVAAEDPVLFKIFRDTTKDAIKKGGDKLTELGLDQFKGEGPQDAFSPNGLSVESYRAQLGKGIRTRAKCLTCFAKLLSQAADSIPVEVAASLRTGMLNNEFFNDTRLADATTNTQEDLANRAELALWCAWALGRDEDYWTKQAAFSNYGSASEVWDWARLRDRLVSKDLGVPEDKITIKAFNPFGKPKLGLDMIGFINWAKSPDMVHTLYEGIPSAGGEAAHHWAYTKMQGIAQMAATAA